MLSFLAIVFDFSVALLLPMRQQSTHSEEELVTRIESSLNSSSSELTSKGNLELPSKRDSEMNSKLALIP